MIFQNILNGLVNILQWIINLLPNFPSTPQWIEQNVDSMLDLVFTNISLFELFIPLEIVGVLLPLALIIANLNRLWGLLRLVYRLIPVIGKN